MNNANGFIKLHRKMLSWGWYQDSVVKDVFIHHLSVRIFFKSAFASATSNTEEQRSRMMCSEFV